MAVQQWTALHGNDGCPRFGVFWMRNQFRTFPGEIMEAGKMDGENLRTAPLGLAFFQGQHITEYSLLAAAGTIVALPIVLLYFFLQRRFISGILNGISSR